MVSYNIMVTPMVVGVGRTSEKKHFTHLEVLMKLVPQGPERLGREF